MWGAILLAGGSGQRMGAGCNKVLLPVDGKSMIVRSVSAFMSHADAVVVVARAEDIGQIREEMAANGLNVILMTGGKTRQDSVWNGLQALPVCCDFVMVHDGARCLVTDDIIQRCKASVETYGTGVAATSVTDTIKSVDSDNIVESTPNRALLRNVQTPQGFRTAVLREAHLRAQAESYIGTDDASLVERMGMPVHLTDGSRSNIKLTTPEDMTIAEALLHDKSPAAQLRVGQGYDVHCLVEGRSLILCGVNVPHTLGLLGHSDADVALHALMDAMLGAMALGDIGKHFPDTDEQYRGISSLLLLEHVVGLLASHCAHVTNCDVTIVAQKPKLLPYIPQMRQNVADALRISMDCVNVKATTTEHLGFEGEEKGISAHAVCMVQVD